MFLYDETLSKELMRLCFLCLSAPPLPRLVPPVIILLKDASEDGCGYFLKYFLFKKIY